MAPPSRSGYSARPDRLDHEAYGIGHMLYSRSTSFGNRTKRMRNRTPGILPTCPPRCGGAPGARGTVGGASIGPGAGVRKRRGHREWPRRE
ncbi:hypothetical protein CP966_27395 [Streptomyces galilaeus]|nr:hypothetical protein CP966_27395 [Streptomyces galilaeus]